MKSQRMKVTATASTSLPTESCCPRSNVLVTSSHSRLRHKLSRIQILLSKLLSNASPPPPEPSPRPSAPSCPATAITTTTTTTIIRILCRRRREPTRKGARTGDTVATTTTTKITPWHGLCLRNRLLMLLWVRQTTAATTAKYRLALSSILAGHRRRRLQ